MALIPKSLRLGRILQRSSWALYKLTHFQRKSFEYKGTEYPLLKAQLFGILGYSTHYSPDYFTDPKTFEPSRFLEANQTHPRNAYRPFERGVRACLGQTLAMDEMKVLLVTLARAFDFELVDHKPVQTPILSHTDMDTKLGKHAFQTFAFTAIPPGPVKMKIRRAESRH